MMNYRFVAITIGDMLKYDAKVNEINRISSALFSFYREHFPNESITSQRASLINDWILSLAKQEMNNDERNVLLARFCRAISPKEFKDQVEAILVQEGIVFQTFEEARFIPIDPPDYSYITENSSLGHILSERWNEAQKCIDNGLFLSALIMMGSMLEGTLLSLISNNPALANNLSSAPRNRQTEKPKKVYEWTLSEMIIVAHELKWLQTDVKDFSMVLRDYRNMVHPMHQVNLCFVPDRDTCSICWEVVRAAVNDLIEAQKAIIKVSRE